MTEKKPAPPVKRYRVEIHGNPRGYMWRVTNENGLLVIAQGVTRSKDMARAEAESYVRLLWKRDAAGETTTDGWLYRDELDPEQRRKGKEECE